MITAKKAFDMTREKHAKELEKARIYIEKNMTYIEKTIRQAAQKGKSFCYIYFTKRDSKKLSIGYDVMALAMASYLHDFGYDSVKWSQDINNDLQFRISWRYK